MLHRLALLLVACLPALAAVDPPAELGPALHAQGDLAAALAPLLHSDDPRVQAWAAYEVGEHRVDGARDALLRLLAVAPPPEDKPGSFRFGAALDALIRLEGAAPPAVVAAVAANARYRAQAIILAARDPVGNCATLLDLLDAHLQAPAWLAACELLEDQRPARLAEHLLRDLTIKLSIDVHDPNRGDGGASGGMFGIVSRTFRNLDGFPPYAVYDITTEAKPGAVVLATGHASVLWVRTEVEEVRCVGLESDRMDQDAARIDLLYRLTLPMWHPCLASNELAEIMWRDAASYHAEATEAYERICTEQRALVAELVKERVMPAADAARYPPRIAVTITDWRQKHEPGLPPLPFNAAEPAAAPQK